MGTDTGARFEREMLPHLGAAVTLARYLLRQPSDAEDAVQEACLQALRRFATYRGENARAWFLTIVRRTCYAWSGRAGRPGPQADPDLIDTLPSRDDDPATAFDRGELRARVVRAVNALPLRFREVIVLREAEELSYQEIAEVIGAPIGTVMSRLSRARQRLQQALRDDATGAET